MTAFHIIQIAIGSAVFAGAIHALTAEERCGQCLKRIYFWQSCVLYKAGGRWGWFHTRCDHVDALKSPEEQTRLTEASTSGGR
jgi:hypothetical protein